MTQHVKILITLGKYVIAHTVSSCLHNKYTFLKHWSLLVSCYLVILTFLDVYRRQILTSKDNTRSEIIPKCKMTGDPKHTYWNEAERDNQDIYDGFKLKKPLVSIAYTKIDTRHLIGQDAHLGHSFCVLTILDKIMPNFPWCTQLYSVTQTVQIHGKWN